jgi:hypothetical protein
MPPAAPHRTPELVRHAARLAASFRRWTGRDLVAPASADDLAERLFHHPAVIVSHGTEPDPVFNYGNAATLTLWEMTWDELVRTPSRLTAEAPEQAERARLLAAVSARGFIDDYAGVRIARGGRRFRIEQATVWTVLDEDGRICGQAATFNRWRFL